MQYFMVCGAHYILKYFSSESVMKRLVQPHRSLAVMWVLIKIFSHTHVTLICASVMVSLYLMWRRTGVPRERI